MSLILKPSGSISYTEINTIVVSAGGSSTSSFNALNRQAYSLTSSSVYLAPDKFSEFVGSSVGVFTFADWNGSVSVSDLGVVAYIIGNAASVSVTPTSYALVGTDTSRTISVSIVVPYGYSNEGVTLTGTKTTTQPARNFIFATWNGSVSVDEDGIVSYTLGNAAAVSVNPTSFGLVATATLRTISVSVTVPLFYFNAGSVVSGNATATQPPKLFTFAMWNGTLSVNCDGVISATTGNAATPITFSPTSYPEVDVATPRSPTITITVPSGYGNSGGTVSGTKSATQPAKFLTTTWNGVVSINKNTGIVSATTGNAASIQSITPSTVALVTTSTNRDITVVIVIPSGYCNSGTLSITKTVSQAAADETINITLNGSHNTWQPSGQGDSATLSITTVSVWNTAWTVEVSDSAWIYLESGVYTGTGNGTKTIAVQPNYVGSAGYNGSTRYGSVRVYKNGAYNSIYDIVQITQTVGTAPSSAPTFTMSGDHTFAWNESGVGYSHQINITITGGTEMTSGKFVMDSSEFALNQTDSHITVAETYTNHWEGNVNNTGLSTYSVGVYPKANNSSTSTQKSAEVSFTAGNSGGSNSSYMTAYQSVAPPAFTIANAGIYGFAVAQNGSITAPQASSGTITNRAYSDGGGYGRVNTDTQRFVVVTVQVPGGYSNSGGTVSGTYYATQPSSPTFSFGDAGVSGFYVDANGNITAPYASAGSIVSVTYNGSIGNSYYSIVSTNTNRTATVYVQVPGGYYNQYQNVSGDVSTTQPATDVFTFSMANVTGFAVSQNGTITEPSAQYGTIYSINYNGAEGGGYYLLVNTNTYRNADVVVNVPGGYYNSGGQVSGTVSTTQNATPTFNFGDWNGGVSIGQNGVISYSRGNANSVTINTGNFPVVYTDTSRDVSVTVYAPFGYYNFGGAGIGGTKTTTQPAAPADPTVTVYTLCNTYQQYYIVEGTYSYPYIEILGYCAYYSETTTQPAAPADPTVTVYTICNTSTNYFVEDTYYYPNVEIAGYCAYYAESTTRSVAMGLYYTEFFSISPSTCNCY